MDGVVRLFEDEDLDSWTEQYEFGVGSDEWQDVLAKSKFVNHLLISFCTNRMRLGLFGRSKAIYQHTKDLTLLNALDIAVPAFNVAVRKYRADFETTPEPSRTLSEDFDSWMVYTDVWAKDAQSVFNGLTTLNLKDMRLRIPESEGINNCRHCGSTDYTENGFVYRISSFYSTGEAEVVCGKKPCVVASVGYNRKARTIEDIRGGLSMRTDSALFLTRPQDPRTFGHRP